MTQTAARPRRSIWPALGIAGLVAWVLVLVVGIAVVASGGPAPAAQQRWSEEVVRGSGARKIALIEVTGEIVGGRGGGGGAFSADTLGSLDYVSQLRQALEDDDVAAVLVYLDTPGGAVVASDEIYRAVRELDAAKPVYAVMGDVAASGGYYVAAGARRVYANPATVTGSIGVIGIFPNLEETAEKLGVRMRVIKSGEHKDIASPFRGMSAEERRILQSLIDDAYDRFVSVVAQGRRLGEERVRELADGRVYSGAQAERLRLVDDLGSLDEAFEALRADAGARDARLVRYRRLGGFADALFGLTGIERRVKQGVVDAGRELSGVPEPGLAYLWLP